MKGESRNVRRLIIETDVDEINECLPEASAKQAKRQLRKPLLSALDIYDKNVSKGRIDETEWEKYEIDAWYRDICDLKDRAFKEIPKTIIKYKGA